MSVNHGKKWVVRSYQWKKALSPHIKFEVFHSPSIYAQCVKKTTYDSGRSQSHIQKKGKDGGQNSVAEFLLHPMVMVN